MRENLNGKIMLNPIFEPIFYTKKDPRIHGPNGKPCLPPLRERPINQPLLLTTNGNGMQSSFHA